MKKPLIGVTGPDKGGFPAWFFAALGVRIAGGRPLRIRPKKQKKEKVLDGLIIGGGADVDPERYGIKESNLSEIEMEEKSTKGFLKYIFTILFYPFLFLIRKLFSIKRGVKLDKERDELELRLIAEAYEKHIPILGICRGCQLINIHFGGTLHQSLKTFYEETPEITSIWPRKKVLLKGESKLREIMDCDSCYVNALHHQAIDKPGKGIGIVARETTDIVQAIEQNDYPFMIGVQWHPEYMPQKRSQRKIFKALIKAASSALSSKAIK